MKFLNTNSHYVYVDDPEDDRDLTPVKPGGEIKATGAFADSLDDTAGVLRASSDEAKAFQSGVKGDHGKTFPANSDEILATNGAQSFPATDPDQQMTESAQRAVAEAQAVSEADNANVKFSSKNAEKLADDEGLTSADLEGKGTGSGGAVKVSDVKDAVAQRDAEAGGNLEQLDDEGLIEIAGEYGIDTDALLDGVEEADQRETLIPAIEQAQGAADGGTITSDQVPKAS